jgi:hypothetical protein
LKVSSINNEHLALKKFGLDAIAETNDRHNNTCKCKENANIAEISRQQYFRIVHNKKDFERETISLTAKILKI